MVAGVVVDVDCDAAQGGHFGGEVVEAGVVLSGDGLVGGGGGDLELEEIWVGE